MAKIKKNKTAIMVLPSGIKENGKLSEFTEKRLNKALSLWSKKRRNFDYLVLCGKYSVLVNKELKYTEARQMYKQAKKKVKKSKILLENKSTDTVLNFIESLELIENKGIKEITIVTSEFHVPRVEYVAKGILRGVKIKIAGVSDGKEKEISSILKEKLIKLYTKYVFFRISNTKFKDLKENYLKYQKYTKNPFIHFLVNSLFYHRPTEKNRGL